MDDNCDYNMKFDMWYESPMEKLEGEKVQNVYIFIFLM